jgi:hypothetical protein
MKTNRQASPQQKHNNSQCKVVVTFVWCDFKKKKKMSLIRHGRSKQKDIFFLINSLLDPPPSIVQYTVHTTVLIMMNRIESNRIE